MEVALRTTERRNDKPLYTDYRPIGSVAVGVTAEFRRRKWLEICGALMSPDREGEYTKFRYHDTLVPLWKPAYLEAFLAFERGDVGLAAAWAVVMKGGQLEAAMPNEPGGKVKAYDAWDWSDQERREFFVVQLDETGRTHRDMMAFTEQRKTLRTRTGPDALPGEVEEVWPTDRFGRRWMMPKHWLDLSVDVGVSGPTLARIADQNQIVHPRMDLKTSPVLLREVQIP